MKMETTKKFARTMNEAFPHGVDYACAIERYRAPKWEKWADIGLAVAVGLCLAYGLYQWMAA
jgi:hypothetical protein